MFVGGYGGGALICRSAEDVLRRCAMLLRRVMLILTMSIHVLCNNASMELLDREYHVPVFAPYYIAVLNGELLKVFAFKVRVVLRWV